MSCADPSRYRCSPERLKKAWSSQDEVSTHVRQGRRQSGKGRAVWAGPGGGGLSRQQHWGWLSRLRTSWERAGGRVAGHVWSAPSQCSCFGPFLHSRSACLLRSFTQAAHVFQRPRGACLLRPLCPSAFLRPNLCFSAAQSPGAWPGVMLRRHGCSPAWFWSRVEQRQDEGKQVRRPVAPNPDRKYLL